MGKNSGIPWCHHTHNLAWGCFESSPACDNCYARETAKRWGWNVWGKDAERRTFGEKYWNQPLLWNAEAQAAGERRRVLCSSMTDVLLNDATIDREREKLWPLIRKTPWLDWLLLTKHPERMKANLPDDWGPNGYDNVWPGVTMESPEYWWRVKMLGEIEAPVRFVSNEPSLAPIGNVDLSRIDWYICGGESGPDSVRRDMPMEWAREVRDRCAREGIAFFFKQKSGRYAGNEPHIDGVTYEQLPTPRRKAA